MQIVYALLCLLGSVLPLLPFGPWLASHGPNLRLLAQQAVASPVSAFAWADVLVSALTVTALVLAEGHRLRMRRPWIALLGLVVGVSLALPLFLLLRERHLANEARRC
jgi:hypothetical protein